MPLKPPLAYAQQLMVLEGIPPTAPPTSAAFYLNICTIIVTAMKDADVLPLPALAAPSGGGPITGKGSLG